MALPTNRKQFKDYILRRLGFPVIEINVDDEQIEDRIDDALSYYQEYHFDGMISSFFKHQITQEDKDRKYIDVPDEIIGITKIVDGGGLQNSAASLFNVQYQLALNDFYNLTSTSLIPYYQAMSHINLFNELFNSLPGIRFNRKTDKLYIDTDWNKYAVGTWIVCECYIGLDPDEYNEIWSDKWLLRYATALVKKQWGANMSKFQGIQLLGGNVMNGSEIYQQANEEIEKLESEMITSFSLPSVDFLA